MNRSLNETEEKRDGWENELEWSKANETDQGNHNTEQNKLSKDGRMEGYKRTGEKQMRGKGDSKERRGKGHMQRKDESRKGERGVRKAVTRYKQSTERGERIPTSSSMLRTTIFGNMVEQSKRTRKGRPG